MTTLQKVCDICIQATDVEGDDLIYFGEWMTKSGITVHYFCLLLSTHLPQQGADNAGILGFLLRDIRKEVQLGKSRRCTYCDKAHATIMCSGCNEYFHLKCGFTSFAISQFKDQFLSFCDKCIPYDAVWERLEIEKPAYGDYKCYICLQVMGACEPSRWIYGKCCKKGFVHSRCMKKYALQAGYYLRCLWCKDPQFRNDVKDMGVFVPDREANWEKEKGAYQDLHRGHQRCDMDKCHCPKGRDYKSGHKWTIIVCKLCGSYGAHNPACIPGMEEEKEKIKEFKCETCSATERTILSQSSMEEAIFIEDSNGINTTLYVQKYVNLSHSLGRNSGVDFSDDSISSMDTVVNTKLMQCKSAFGINSSFETPRLTSPSVQNTFNALHIPTLTQYAESNEKQNRVVASSVVCLSEPLECTMETSVESNKSNEKHSENVQNSAIATNSLGNVTEIPDPKEIEMLVGRFLDLFDP